MKKKRPKPAAKPPPARARRVKAPGNRAPVVRPPAPETWLQYKVVELSTVDEASLERTVNDWGQKGWNLDGVQFAMREASKRPAMAFVFFTREAPVESAEHPDAQARAARHKLARLAEAGSELGEGEGEHAAPAPPPRSTASAHERLRQLAEEGDDDPARLVEGTRWVELEE